MVSQLIFLLGALLSKVVANSDCCNDAPFCYRSNTLPGGDFENEHYIGSRGFDYDGRYNPRSSTWIGRSSDGSGHLSKVRSPTFLPCSTRFAYKVTHYVGIDDNEGSDDTLGTLDGFRGHESNDRNEKEFKRSDFKQKQSPFPFTFVHRQLECNNETRFGIFSGVGYPYSDRYRRSAAEIMHYATTISRFTPELYNTSNLQIGSFCGGAIGSFCLASASSVGYIANGPNILLAMGSLRVDFVLSLENNQIVNDAQSYVGIIEIWCGSCPIGRRSLSKRLLRVFDFSDDGTPTSPIAVGVDKTFSLTF